MPLVLSLIALSSPAFWSFRVAGLRSPSCGCRPLVTGKKQKKKIIQVLMQILLVLQPLSSPILSGAIANWFSKIFQTNQRWIEMIADVYGGPDPATCYGRYWGCLVCCPVIWGSRVRPRGLFLSEGGRWQTVGDSYPRWMRFVFTQWSVIG